MSDTTKAEQAMNFSGDRDGQSPEIGAVADDFKIILRQLAAQMAATDVRHAQALRDMEARMSELGRQTSLARESQPDANAPALERLEDQMTDFAEQLGDAGREREAVDHSLLSAALAAAESPLLLEPAPAPVPEPALVQEPTRVAADASFYHPAEVSLEGEFAAELSAVHSNDARANDTGEWDREQADALARAYEIDLAHGDGVETPVPVTHAQEEAHTIAVADEPAAISAYLPAPAPMSHPLERQWLEDKLADVARHIEAATGRLVPHSAFDALAKRFEAFEGRVGAALEQVATKGDLAPLHGLEQQLSELQSQLLRSEQDLERVGAIEHDLAALAERLSDTHLAALVAPAQTSDSEIEDVATKVAERITAQMSQLLPAHGSHSAPAIEPEALTALHGLVRALIADQQSGGNHVASMLADMQTAMSGLVERVESLSQVQAQAQPHASIQAGHNVSLRAHAQPAAAPYADELLDDLGADAVGHLADAAGEPEVAQHFGRLRQSQAAVSSPAPAISVAPAPAQSPGGARVARQVRTSRDEGTPAPELKPEAPGTPRRTPRSVNARPQANEPPASEPTIAPVPAKVSRIPAVTPRLVMTSAIVLLVAGGAALVASRVLKSEPAAQPVLTISLDPQPSVRGADAKGASEMSPASGQATADQPPSTAGVQAGSAPQGSMTPPLASKPSGSAPVKPGARLPGTPGASLEEQPGTLIPVAGPVVGPVESPLNELAIPSVTLVDGLQPSPGEPAPVAFPVQREQAKAATLAGVSVVAPSDAVSAATILRAEESHQTAILSAKIRDAQTSGQVSGPAAMGIVNRPPLEAAPEPANARPVGGEAVLVTKASLGTVAMSGNSLAGRAKTELPSAQVGPMSLRVAAANGDPSAEFEVAARFAEGLGVAQDLKQAMIWYQRSAMQGFAPAQYRLGTHYERGLGTEIDPGRARVWYTRAADQGSVKAMHNLGVLSASAGASPADYEVAAQWFGKAADRGLPDSQFNLGVLAQGGMGMEKSLVVAYKWFSLAAQAGDKQADKRRQAVQQKLTADELRAAEQLIQQWKITPSDRVINDAKAAGDIWRTRATVQATTPH